MKDLTECHGAHCGACGRRGDLTVRQLDGVSQVVCLAMVVGTVAAVGLVTAGYFLTAWILHALALFGVVWPVWAGAVLAALVLLIVVQAARGTRLGQRKRERS